ncbi:TPA: polysaccharide pyruvyl transferase family protein [Clostridium perfringens]|nr:polysaccharide pyruvyl transferase family protein [Clostridium perfringens]
MKIAVLTWTYKNYGTLLQAYALQKFLTDEGYNVSLINYIPKNENVIKYNKYNLKNISRKLKNRYKTLKEKNNMNLLDDKYKDGIKKRELLFKNFIKDNLPLTEEYKINEMKKLNHKYDAWIVGSDQIWSPKYLDGTFFLNFLDENTRKISYAPSFGVEELDNKAKKIIKPWLDSFNFISVREKAGQQILKYIIEKQVPVVLDPTLLFSCREWNSIIKHRDEENKTDHQKYLLCYFLSENETYWDIVKWISEKYNYKVKVIPIKPLDFNNNYKKVLEIDPFDFVELIRDAEFVITDSFHGTIFSINYNKDFLTISRFNDSNKGSENSRLTSILSYLGLKDRFIMGLDDIVDDNYELRISNEKYNFVGIELEKLRCKSKKYLSRSLK